MAIPNRPPRARSTGGRTLMLLGVLLALAAGTIVIYIVSQATGTTTQNVNVVVAKQDLPAGTILSVTAAPEHLLITDAFAVKSVPADFVPQNAFPYVSADDLNSKLNNFIVVGTFYSGEILRNADPRLVAAGTGAPGSLTNSNPAQLKQGQVLMALEIQSGAASNGGKPIYSVGDNIDVIVTECNLPPSTGAKDSGSCETQTTLQNVYVYAVSQGSLVVVLSHQDALTLKFLKETGKVDLVIRKPGDPATSTVVVDNSYIVKAFGY